MVARAVSPTSAATSTRFASTTMGDFTARAAAVASRHSSVRAEPFARDSGGERAHFAARPRARPAQDESGRALDSLHWSHFLRRTGSHFAGKCSKPRSLKLTRILTFDQAGVI